MKTLPSIKVGLAFFLFLALNAIGFAQNNETDDSAAATVAATSENEDSGSSEGGEETVKLSP
ncbi:MAG TPA: hypothetical protein DCG39_01310, partial [Opitutae bacterium]|nr:hypothetical protein [Opitutae bacterium]